MLWHVELQIPHPFVLTDADCNAAPSTLLRQPRVRGSLRHRDHNAADSIDVRLRDCGICKDWPC
jgi:hypothetical protein